MSKTNQNNSAMSVFLDTDTAIRMKYLNAISNEDPEEFIKRLIIEEFDRIAKEHQGTGTYFDSISEAFYR